MIIVPGLWSGFGSWQVGLVATIPLFQNKDSSQPPGIDLGLGCVGFRGHRAPGVNCRVQDLLELEGLSVEGFCPKDIL